MHFTCIEVKTVEILIKILFFQCKARFKRRTFHVPNAISTIVNKLINRIYCLNCIRHMKSSTFEPGLRLKMPAVATRDVDPDFKMEIC